MKTATLSELSGNSAQTIKKQNTHYLGPILFRQYTFLSATSYTSLKQENCADNKIIIIMYMLRDTQQKQ
jgi:hypothetical protein